jgi:hypothetical protein
MKGVSISSISKGLVLYNLFDSAIADCLALHTCRHGTSIVSYVKIMFTGGKANKGGTGGESAYRNTHDPDSQETKKRLAANKGRIYVFRDLLEDNVQQYAQGLAATKIKLFSILKRTFLPLDFSYQGNTNLFANEKSSEKAKQYAPIAGALLTLLTPIVKYRFTPDELNSFEEDGDLQPFALYTDKDISPWHLGISGSLIQGVNRQMFSRIKDNPVKVAKGFTKLIAALALSAIWIGIPPSSNTLLTRSIQTLKSFSENHPYLFRMMLAPLVFSTW